MNDLFRFEDVVVRFDDTTALDGITLTIPDGGLTVLLGASGSGKSTLLRLCNRLEVPTTGRVCFRGTDISETDPLVLRRRVGMVFQRPTLFPGTVRQNLLEALPDATEEACVRALARAAIAPDYLDRVGDDLSGGEQQRVCLARTLITEPEVLLMDEPTSALDPSSTRQLEERACSVAAEGIPILWVTHDLAQAERISDRHVVLIVGRLADEHEAAHFEASEPSDHDHDHGDSDAAG
jgi:putative ABC transport system ATP-binding protein